MQAAGFGAFAGMAGGYVGSSEANLSGKLLPYRIGGSIIDPNKPILLQNIGVKNPCPAYAGEAAAGAASGSIPLIIDKLNKEQ